MTERGYQDLRTSEMAQFAAINMGMNDSTDTLANWQIFADGCLSRVAAPEEWQHAFTL